MADEYLLNDDDVIVTKSDLLGNIVSVNDAMITASGYSKAELIGQSHRLLRHPDVPKEIFADMWSTISQGYAWHGTLKNKRKNGDYYWVVANVSPIFDDEEQITGYLSVRYSATEAEKEAAQHLCASINAGTGKMPNLSIRRFDSWFLLGVSVVLFGLVFGIIHHAKDHHTEGFLSMISTFGSELLALIGLGLVFARGLALYRPNSQQLKAIHSMASGHFKKPVMGRDAWTNALNLLRIRVAQNVARKRDALRESAILNAAMNSATTSLMVLDPKLKIISLNESLYDLLFRLEQRLKTVIPDFSVDRLIGQNFSIFHTNAAKRNAMIQSLRSVMASEFTIADVTLRITIVPVQIKSKTIAFTVEFVDRTEKVLLERKITDALTHLSSLDMSNYHQEEVFLDTKGLSGFFVDLAKHINYAMQIHRQVLENAITHQQKSEFLANVSHELRTPLNSINVLSGLLMRNQDGNLSSRQLEQIEVIHYAGNDLLNLINDLLDAAKIDAGKMSITIELVDINTLLTDLKLMFEPLIKMKGLSFDIDINADLPPLESDGIRIRQIIKNFLSNALKFTERGSIRLSSTCSECGDFTLIQVTDTGIGIAENKLQYIFERFKQADDHGTARKFGGTGLGLSISLDLAHLLDGDIHVESVEQQGSTFTLMLRNTQNCHAQTHDNSVIPEKARIIPVITQQSKTQSVDAISLDGDLSSDLNVGELVGKSILVVDDNIRNLFIMTALLENTGIPVLSSQSAKDAYEQIIKTPSIGLVLTDLMMPDMDGYELIAKIRANSKTATLPIIAISAQTEAEAEEKSLMKGADAYLSKPVSADALITSIKQCLPPPPVKRQTEN